MEFFGVLVVRIDIKLREMNYKHALASLVLDLACSSSKHDEQSSA